jgi:sugar diacid utilization regulator
VQEHIERLERAEQVHRQLSEIVLAGHGLAGVVDLLTELVGEPVVIIDELGRVLGAAGTPADAFGEQLARGGLDGVTAAGEGVAAVVGQLARLETTDLARALPEREHARLVVPIVAGAELLGSVWVETRPEAADEERLLIEQAVRVVGLELLKERSIAEAERRLQREFLDELFSPRIVNPDVLVRRAAELGVDLRVAHRLVVAMIASAGPDHRPRTKATERLIAALRGQPWCAFAGETAGHVVALVAAEQRESVQSELRRAVRSTAGEAAPWAVLSPPCQDPAGYRSHFVACERVLHVLALQGPAAEAVVDLDQAEFLALLFRDGREGELRHFARSRLGPLLELREPQRTELLRTLAAYFESGMSASRAAAALHVHVNTVYYRVERLRRLLGSGFAEPLRAVDLQIALFAHRLVAIELEESSKRRPETLGDLP